MSQRAAPERLTLGETRGEVANATPKCLALGQPLALVLRYLAGMGEEPGNSSSPVGS